MRWVYLAWLTPRQCLHAACRTVLAATNRGCSHPCPAALQGLVVGGCICYDMNFPEMARDLTFKGAELMVRIQGYM